MLPSRYTSQESLDDAAGCAERLGVRLDEIAISPAVDAFAGMLTPHFGNRAPDLTEENIQARIRGVSLMALSNKLGLMLMTTGNKSEMAVGYATLYGDMCGGYNVLKDVYKTDVYAGVRMAQRQRPTACAADPIPERILTKAPSAELRPDQKDQDSLPEYAELDAILHGLVEEEATWMRSSPAVMRPRRSSGSSACSTTPNTSAARGRSGREDRPPRASAVTAAIPSSTASGTW